MSKYQYRNNARLTGYHSVALRNYPHRHNYLRDLIRRLDRVPQILPASYAETARTRGQHCRNMAAIASRIGLQHNQVKFRQSLSMAAMLHDIGHATHGHASERAINEWLGYTAFSNDHHSCRVLYFQSSKENFDVPMFTTPAFECLPHLSYPMQPSPLSARLEQSQAITPKSRVLEFLDDLENTIGDSGDLARNAVGQVNVLSEELCPQARVVFQMHETVNAVLFCMRRFGFDGSYNSLLSLSQPASAIQELMAKARVEIENLRVHSKLIQAYDIHAREQTLDMCEWAHHLDPGIERGCSEQWVIDVVSAIDLEVC
ncbi:MAG: HD domain-containing protein [Sulfuriferula sp.]